MGRREQPIRPCSKSLWALAAWLRSGREEAGLTYEQLAARTSFSPDTLARAASGSSVPRNVKVVVAYAVACGLSAAEAERLWKVARRDEARAAGVLNGQRSGLHISVVKDFAGLHSAIVEQYQNAGSPPLRTLDDRIGGHGRLPHSTVSRVLNGQSRPSRPFVLAFAEAVNIRPSEVAEWGKAWDRADRDRRSTRSRRTSRVQPAVQDRLTKHDPVTPRDLQLLMSDLEVFTRRERGIKLLVIPEAEYSQANGPASRMTRELLVDQAQRQGDLSCPRCHRPSFGYDDAQGWRAALCTDCTTPSAPSAAALPAPEPQKSDALSERPRLPQRVPGRSWPPPGFSDSFETLGADVFEATGLPPEVCCRLCQGFHGAYDGCQPRAGSGGRNAAGRAPAAPASAAAGSMEETVYGAGTLAAYLDPAVGAPSRGSPAIPVRSGTVLPRISLKSLGGSPGVSVGQGEPAAAAPGAACAFVKDRRGRGPERGAGARGGARKLMEQQQSRGPRDGPRLGRDHV
ncbi:helix-turn-helix domain-containing protein [Streptomyces sp. enrichment culture]|uniref:helix-turn-helix domain-containing protein n=1 Tax=Streptomyces sp. enrichment culture TaxID=1795815 RepID=UPI003F56A66B